MRNIKQSSRRALAAAAIAWATPTRVLHGPLCSPSSKNVKEWPSSSGNTQLILQTRLACINTAKVTNHNNRVGGCHQAKTTKMTSKRGRAEKGVQHSFCKTYRVTTMVVTLSVHLLDRVAVLRRVSDISETELRGEMMS